jgi:transposase-like protein
MDPQTVFCPNLDCPARGQIGQSNVTIHSQRDARYRCSVCRKTFSARQGTPFFRKQTEEDLITLVITLIASGCPEAAIVVAFDLHPRPVRNWVTAAGQHAATIQQQLVEQPLDLGQVQPDELRVKTQAGVVWMALALQVATRLWLGGVISPPHDTTLLRALADLIARCALVGPLLIAVDGLVSYVAALQRAFRTRQPRPGKRPALVPPWPGLVIGQVVKQYVKRRVVGVVRRVAIGTWEGLGALLERTQGGGVLNTSYIERLNATFRRRRARLGRRTRHGAKQQARLHAALYLVGTRYNFCTWHHSLTSADGRRRTPAMAAGITAHCWSVDDLLHYQVPPARWQPPRQRGRPSKATKELIERWIA